MSSIPPPCAWQSTPQDLDSLQILEDGLIEIAAAVKTDQELVGNGRGESPFVSSSGYGLLWNVLYIGLEYIEPVRAEQLSRSLENISTIFQNQLRRILLVADDHDHYLAALCAGQTKIKDKDIDLNPLHKEIAAWNKATYHVLQFFQDSGIRAKVTAVYARSAPAYKDKDALPYFPFADQYLQRFKNYQALIDIRKRLLRDPPYDLLVKVSMNQTLTFQERQKVENWVDELKEKQETIDLNFLHLFCKLVVAHAPRNAKGTVDQRAALEHYIQQRSKGIFSRTYSPYVEWRGRLNQGERISFSSDPKDDVALGPEVARTTAYVAFQILGDGNHLLLISNNPIINSLHQIACKADLPIPVVEIVKISEATGVAKVKRLIPLHEAIKLKGGKEKLDKEDSKQLQSLVPQLAKLVAQIGEAVLFAEDCVQYDPGVKELRLNFNAVALSTSPAALLYEEVEAVIERIAGHVQQASHFLRVQSGIKGHDITYFYETIVSEVKDKLNTKEPVGITTLITIRNVGRYGVGAERAGNFTRRVQEIFALSIAKLSQKEIEEKDKDQKKRKEAVYTAIMQYLDWFGTLDFLTRDSTKTDRMQEEIALNAKNELDHPSGIVASIGRAVTSLRSVLF